MKKTTGTRERSKTRTSGTDLDGDTLASLEQQQRDVEELIARFDSTGASDDTDTENG
jgi:hypothetical protein